MKNNLTQDFFNEKLLELEYQIGKDKEKHWFITETNKKGKTKLKQLLSFSSLLKEFTREKYESIPLNILEAAQERGKDYHKKVQTFFELKKYRDREKYLKGLQEQEIIETIKYINLKKKSLIGAEIGIYDNNYIGFLDLLFKKGDTITIIELKTGNYTNIKEEWKWQILFYRELIKSYFKKFLGIELEDRKLISEVILINHKTHKVIAKKIRYAHSYTIFKNYQILREKVCKCLG